MSPTKLSKMPAPETLPSEQWNVQQLGMALRKAEVSDKVIRKFSENKLEGKDLQHLTSDRLMSMGLTMRDCLDVEHFAKKNQDSSEDLVTVGMLKIFNDPIHGNIQLHPACIAIIDTPQFQRLRYLKQLGLVYFVYPGASHNRFEHSLGVCHLAGQFVQHLRDTQKSLGITDVDILCVEIAGLCHDLGHGPYSHLFDGPFMREVNPKEPWKHEKLSVKLLTHLIDQKGLMKNDGILTKYGLTPRDILFIKEMIAGPDPDNVEEPKMKENMSDTKDWPYRGRGPEKAYLYEIIANKRNGIDVDKWDYIARDCHQLGVRNNFDHARFIKFARVIEVENADTNVKRMQICLRDKELVNMYNMFSTRYTLHKVAYQHEVHGALEIMMTEILIKANKHIKFRGEKEQQLTMSECVEKGDMIAYTKLNDNILSKIEDCDPDKSEDIRQAQEIIGRIFNRNLYKLVYESKPLKPDMLEEKNVDKLQEKIFGKEKQDGHKTGEKSFFVQVASLDYGMKEENPLEKVSVYSKSDLNKARLIKREEISRILAPNSYNELLLRIYTRGEKSDDVCKAVKERVKNSGVIKTTEQNGCDHQ